MDVRTAIEYLEDPIGKREQHDEAIGMAIKALEAYEPKQGVSGSISGKNPEKMHDRTTGDLISRQAAIYAVGSTDVEGLSLNDVITVTEACISAIERLPAAEPERKTGHWYFDENGMDWNLGAWKCSECRVRNDNIPPYIQMQGKPCRIGNPLMWQGSRFCPNCGAKMQEGQDE